MHDSIDQYDFSKLLAAIIRQALDDYIKLQHPKYRKKKYLLEAYQQAIDMFFDDEYRLLAIQNDDGEDMSLKDMVQTALNSDRSDIQKIRDHAIEQALDFWNKKEIKTVEIPDMLQVSGHVYQIEHTDSLGSYSIDYNTKIITLNKKPGLAQEETFIDAVFQVMLYHEDVPIKKTNMIQISKAWYRILKMNNCFTGAD